MHNKEKIQCIHLRTKKLYVTNNAENESGAINDSATGQYWCLGTMSPVGPDDGFAAPERCKANRSCFKAKDLIT